LVKKNLPAEFQLNFCVLLFVFKVARELSRKKGKFVCCPGVYLIKKSQISLFLLEWQKVKKTHVANGTSVCFDVFCGPHLPLAFHFVCSPGGGGAANKMEGKRKFFLYLVAPPRAAVGYSTNSSFCLRTTVRNHCAVRKTYGFSISYSGDAFAYWWL